MMSMLTQLIACRWASGRLQRYLDADPSAPLTAAELSRIEGHLETCERCHRVATEQRALHRALSMLGGPLATEPESVQRMRDFMASLPESDRR